MLSSRKSVIFIVTLILCSMIFYSTPCLSSGHEEAAAHKSEAVSVSGAHGEGAVESGHEEASHDEGSALKDFWYRVFNFVVMVVILVWGIKKSGLAKELSGRIEDIKQTLDRLTNEQKEWEKNYHEVEAKLKEFEQEREKILERFRKEGLEEKERIIQEAKDKAKRIIEQAEKSIEQELESSKMKLKKELMQLAAFKAQEIISKVITEKDQENLINEFIEKVEKAH